MANEVQVNLNVNVRNGKLYDPFMPGTVQISQASTGMHRPVCIVNSSAYEAVPFGDVVTPRLMYGRNLSGTKDVLIGMSTSAGSTAVTPLGRIRAGDLFLIPPTTDCATRLKWKTAGGTGSARVDLRITEK